MPKIYNEAGARDQSRVRETVMGNAADKTRRKCHMSPNTVERILSGCPADLNAFLTSKTAAKRTGQGLWQFCLHASLLL